MFTYIILADKDHMNEIPSTNMTTTNLTVPDTKSNMASGSKSRTQNVIARPTETTTAAVDVAAADRITSDASSEQIKDECLPGMSCLSRVRGI